MMGRLPVRKLLSLWEAGLYTHITQRAVTRAGFTVVPMMCVGMHTCLSISFKKMFLARI